MRLRINNFAKIKEADLDFQGITVIAGENNSGKSTVGKILFGLFNSYYNMPTKIQDNRWRAIARQVRQIVNETGAQNEEDALFVNEPVVRGYFGIYQLLISNKPQTAESCHELVMKYLAHIEDSKKRQEAPSEEKIREAITRIYDYPGNRIRNTIISREFRDIFSRQVNSLKNDDKATVLLDIKNHPTRLVFEAEECKESTAESNINRGAIYIENPFILDQVGNSFLMANNSPMTKVLWRKLIHGVDVDAISENMRADNWKTIVEKLNQIIHGDFVTQSGYLTLHQEGLRRNLFVNNLSAGSKTFAILKRLLDLNNINEQDVLILDEPEIHLHPEWQLVYAELIVLLQKTFNLTVLLTTHSPYFLEAIEVYTQKHGIEDKVRYYLSQQENSEVTFENVTGNTSSVYQKLLAPFQKLEKIRFQLGMNE